jgi:microsomal dipeptidase-like Zn-dependent dipeptidase
MKRAFSSVAVVLLILVVVLVFGPGAVDRAVNRVIPRTPPTPSRAAIDLMGRLLIVDLHADSLLWNRDLSVRVAHGHVDIPRLIAGNVAVQAFTVVTKIPFFVNIDRNGARSDMVTLLAIIGRWPIATWFDLTERALYQARKLRDAAARSEGRLVIIQSVADLDRYLDLRARGSGITAGFLGIEGAHALEGKVTNVDVLFAAGFRMMSLAHFSDNDIAGSAHGKRKGGLTDMGREMIRRMEEKGMLLDLAHASVQAMDEALALATRPVVVSHTGVRGTCDNNRNLSDDQVRAVAAHGGVIGIGYWDVATCGTDGQAVAKAIRYTADLVGVRHVGLGSDFDGATTTPFDTTGLVEIVDGLLTQGFTAEEIALITGGNALRVLRATLP